MIERLKKGFSDLNISVSDTQLKQLETYAALLAEWNEKINLTAITEPTEVAEKHFLDSAMCLKTGVSGKVIDVGTGAGFPGLVLKILKPEIELCLLDSLQKRIGFLQAVCEALSLDGVTFVHARAEDGGQDKLYRESFDFAVARGCKSFHSFGILFAFCKDRRVLCCHERTESKRRGYFGEKCNKKAGRRGFGGFGRTNSRYRLRTRFGFDKKSSTDPDAIPQKSRKTRKTTLINCEKLSRFAIIFFIKGFPNISNYGIINQ